MLPQNKRISRKLFPTSRPAKSFHSVSLTLRVYPNKRHTEASRFSFVVSKKIEKTAVARNTLRRLGFAAVQEFSKNIQNGFLCVFFFKKTPPATGKETKTKSSAELRREIEVLLKDAGILVK